MDHARIRSSSVYCAIGTVETLVRRDERVDGDGTRGTPDRTVADEPEAAEPVGRKHGDSDNLPGIWCAGKS